MEGGGARWRKGGLLRFKDDNCTKVGPFGFLMRYCVTILSTVIKHSSLHKFCS